MILSKLRSIISFGGAKMDLGKKLQQLRKSRNLSQGDLAELLTINGQPITNKGVWSWEKGNTIPNAYQFLALCKVLKVTDINEVFLGEGLTIDRFVQISSRKLPVYTQGVSAGFGEYINDESFDIVTVPISTPSKTDYGLIVHGDSMNPTIKDGDLVWVEKTSEVNKGDIGIFYVDGELYIKELGNNELISHNVEYKPIPIIDATEFRVMGKVLKVENDK